MPCDAPETVALRHFDGGLALPAAFRRVGAVLRVKQCDAGKALRGEPRHLHGDIAAHRDAHRHQGPISQRQRRLGHRGDAVPAQRIRRFAVVVSASPSSCAAKISRVRIKPGMKIGVAEIVMGTHRAAYRRRSVEFD